MKLDQLVQFYNDLAQFDPNEPIAVSWSANNGLIYRQYGKVLAIPYMSNYYFPKPKLVLGVLMPTDFRKLMDSLKTLIQDPALESHELNTIIGDYGFRVYKLFRDLSGPQLVYNIEFTSITNKWISKYILYRYSNISRILLKSINHENRIRRSKMREE